MLVVSGRRRRLQIVEEKKLYNCCWNDYDITDQSNAPLSVMVESENHEKTSFGIGSKSIKL